MPKGHTKEQIVAAITAQEGGETTKEICRRMGISTATFYSGIGALGARLVPSQRASCGGADESAERNTAVSAMSRSAGCVALAAEGAGRDAGAVWLSQADGAVEARRMEGQCQAGVSDLQRGRFDGAHQTAQEAGEPCACSAERRSTSERTLVDGFHSGADRRRTELSGAERDRSVHAQVHCAGSGAFDDGQQSRG